LQVALAGKVHVRSKAWNSLPTSLQSRRLVRGSKYWKHCRHAVLDKDLRMMSPAGKVFPRHWWTERSIMPVQHAIPQIPCYFSLAFDEILQAALSFCNAYRAESESAFILISVLWTSELEHFESLDRHRHPMGSVWTPATGTVFHRR
jgi:hypothetical protein